MGFNRILILCGAIAISISSCAPIYIPNTRNTPLFRGQGEFQGTALITTGVELQGAYAVSDNIGVIGSYSTLSENRNDPQNTSATFKRKNSYFEGGIGYFKADRSRRIEVYVGYGQGKSTTTGQYSFFFPTFGQQEIILTGNYNRYFIQPTIGTNKKGFNISFTPRISAVDFSEFTAGVVTETPDEKMVIFIEPALTTKFRLNQHLDGMFQLGLNFSGSGDVYFDFVPVQAAIGVQLHLGGDLRTRVY